MIHYLLIKKKWEVDNIKLPNFNRYIYERILIIAIKNNKPFGSIQIDINKIYNSSEFHNVCIYKDYFGMGLCKILINIAQYYAFFKLKLLHILIYCKNINIPACKCYKGTFGEQIFKNKKINYIDYNNKKQSEMINSFYTDKKKHNKIIKQLYNKYRKINIL